MTESDCVRYLLPISIDANCANKVARSIKHFILHLFILIMTLYDTNTPSRNIFIRIIGRFDNALKVILPKFYFRVCRFSPIKTFANSVPFDANFNPGEK